MTEIIYPCGCTYTFHLGYDDGHGEDNHNWVESDGEDYEFCPKHTDIIITKYRQNEKVIKL